MKLTSKEFLWFQAGIIFLLLATMDGIVRGPMEMILKQTEYNVWLYTGVINQRIDMLSGIAEQEAKK
jgi:hypothetical protein